MSNIVVESKTNDEVDYIYYNYLLYNDTDETIKAEFEETRDQPIINVAREWDVAVVRFSIPSVTIPLFRWQEKRYYVGWQNGEAGQIFTREVLLYVPNSDTNIEPYKNYVFNYQLWLDNINHALRLVWDDAGQVTSEVPFVYQLLGTDVDRFGVVAPDGPLDTERFYPYDDPIVPNVDNIRLWFSYFFKPFRHSFIQFSH